jgi:peptide/nickel transport system permease protein
VILFTFLLEHMVPGGPAVVALGTRANPQSIYLYNKNHGLLSPIIVQFFNYLKQVLTFHLGTSITYSAPVWTLIRSALTHTVVLVTVALVLQFVIAIPLGAFQAQRRNSRFDYIATGTTFVLYSIPVFLIGEFMITLFALQLHWLPGLVSQTASAWSVFTSPLQFLMPIFTLTFLGIGGLSRYQRSSMVEVLAQDYIRTARAKGLPERLVVRRHALRNSVLPIITIIGLSLPALVGGALITEYLFDIPGMGSLTLQAATTQDMPVVVGTTIVATAFTIVGSIMADLLYASADPRIRTQGR